MERRRRRTPSHILMRNIVIASGVASTIINLVVLAVSASAGRWLFGSVFCQLYGLLSQVLISGSAWMVALAAFERCYFVLSPTEHPATFSHTNLKVMVFGLYLILVVLHTSPLYGWGEYSFHRGGLGLHIGMTNQVDLNVSKETSFNSFVLGEEHIMNSNNSTSEGFKSCSEENRKANTIEFTPQTIASTIQYFLCEEFCCESRASMGSELVITLRFSKQSSIEIFQKSFYEGLLVTQLQSRLVTEFSECNSTIPTSEFHLAFLEEELRHYQDVYIPFQGLGICSLDFSPVNKSVSSWIPFTVLINIAPYLIALSCGCVLHKCTSSDIRQFSPKADIYLFSSACGIISVIPYYYVNCQNHLGNYVNHIINVSVTTCYFSSGLAYTVIYLCFRSCVNSKFVDELSKNEYSECDENSINLRRRIIRGTDRSTSENSDLSHSIL